ncbi:MAG: hypothetical protein H8E39_00220 [Alphaproteobacteria bacterium]|nr:hypothetical protein [Alphaproteobacteria bacterium]
MTKTLEDYFVDWEGNAFGFGYGTGEEHTLGALKMFMEACPIDGGYDYRILEGKVSPTVAWLLINVLCREDILEYGTSPRFAWLTEKGKRLKTFVGGQSADDLGKIIHRDKNYIHCYPDICNCGPNGYEAGRVCQNPFWLDKPKSD